MLDWKKLENFDVLICSKIWSLPTAFGFIHLAIHNIISLFLNSGVSVQPEKKSHEINAISTNTTSFEE